MIVYMIVLRYDLIELRINKHPSCSFSCHPARSAPISCGYIHGTAVAGFVWEAAPFPSSCLGQVMHSHDLRITILLVIASWGMYGSCGGVPTPCSSPIGSLGFSAGSLPCREEGRLYVPFHLYARIPCFVGQRKHLVFEIEK